MQTVFLYSLLALYPAFWAGVVRPLNVKPSAVLIPSTVGRLDLRIVADFSSSQLHQV